VSEDFQEQEQPRNIDAWNPLCPVEYRLQAAVELILKQFPQAVIMGMPNLSKAESADGLFLSWQGDASSVSGWLNVFQSHLSGILRQAMGLDSAPSAASDAEWGNSDPASSGHRGPQSDSVPHPETKNSDKVPQTDSDTVEGEGGTRMLSPEKLASLKAQEPLGQ